MSVLLTGVAGFIGMHTARRLLDRGERVIGIDVMNAYYDPGLKEARLATLRGSNGFSFEKLDFSDRGAVLDLVARNPDIDRIVHLGAQAGVRYSIEEPFDYLTSNLTGQLVLMEACRAMMERPGGCRSFVYASSSSVYGANREMPFALDQRTDHPMSFYGATKKAGEVMAQSYAHLYRIPSIGLRFFTVYGPWGRPDMSPYIFTDRIMKGETIQVFNNGAMSRDFTYVDDIVSGVVAALDTPPETGEAGAPHRLYNLGNNRPVPLMDYIGVIERACGKKAVIEYRPLQPGDVLETYADITDSTRDLGFAPTTPIEEGIPRFVDWYRRYHGA
jgi:UDP-glucuronate 4-epimerase